ncbi:Homeobox protein PKNOX2 [Labeo rohita]|uniref:Homeobox protein PKNOX2 n=1 Tax=Labeo rohita TaxID=84645 RepID=A0ABQ8MBS6_LABRO|nr:Homeobox protein PKNOX2 [Labeo rohita]
MYLHLKDLHVKLSHDATCVPSTSIDHDGHTECSSTIVPGEPTASAAGATQVSVTLDPQAQLESDKRAVYSAAVCKPHAYRSIVGSCLKAAARVRSTGCSTGYD